MKKNLSILIFIFFSTILFAVSNNTIPDAVQTYRLALNYYENGDYGKSLRYCEDAILYKKQKVEQELDVLKQSLSSKQVRRVGDDINQILVVLNERNEKDSIKIINFYIKKKGSDFFENSISKMLSYIQGIKVFPEAQKLIGDIYKLEGEYDFAEEYYKMALENKNVLDVSDEQYEILYMLADISRLENDENLMEIRLLNILVDDKIYNDNGFKSAILETVKTNNSSTVEKLFTLYRANNFYSLRAYKELAEYYHDKNENEKALLFATLFTITSFTKIYDTIKLRNFDYSYENLGTFFQEASFYSDIVEWGSKNYAWESFYVLAKYANEYGYTTFAKELLKILAQFSPERYWQQEAVLQLEKFEEE